LNKSTYSRSGLDSLDGRAEDSGDGFTTWMFSKGAGAKGLRGDQD